MNSWNVLTEATQRGVNLMTRPELLSLGGPHPVTALFTLAGWDLGEIKFKKAQFCIINR